MMLLQSRAGGGIYGLYEHRWFGFLPDPSVGGGKDAVVLFVTGYLLEWSLSVDSIFVIALIFAYLRIPALYQYRVLFWGIVGAIVLRGIMIIAGAALLSHFDWMFYVFGAILLVSALRMLRDDDEERDFGSSFPARLVRRFIPVTDELHRARFFVRREGRLHATPLFVALVMVELTDVVFAVDSIPAILAVTLSRRGAGPGGAGAAGRPVLRRAALRPRGATLPAGHRRRLARRQRLQQPRPHAALPRPLGRGAAGAERRHRPGLDLPAHLADPGIRQQPGRPHGASPRGAEHRGANGPRQPDRPLGKRDAGPAA